MGRSREPLVKNDSWPYRRREKHREVAGHMPKRLPSSHTSVSRAARNRRLTERRSRILVADASFAEIAGAAFFGKQRDGAFHSFFGGVRGC